MQPILQQLPCLQKETQLTQPTRGRCHVVIKHPVVVIAELLARKIRQAAVDGSPNCNN